MTGDPLALAYRLAEILDELGIPYAVGGAVASAIHGEPRATEDLDIVVVLDPAHVEPLIRKLGADYYVPTGHLRAAVDRHGSFNVIHLPSVRKIDIFVAGSDAFSRDEMARRMRMTIDAHPAAQLWVASPEDVILHKLRWYVKGGRVSDRQWRDVLGVLKVQGARLDREYLSTWAERLGFSDLLQEAFRASGLDVPKVNPAE